MKIKIKKILFFLLLSIITCKSMLICAQDFHFTMYNAVPVIVNPAYSGFFDGKFRAATNHRSQWSGVSSSSLDSYSFFIDAPVLRKKNNTNHLGIGLGAFRDKIGTLALGTSKFKLSISSILGLDSRNTLSIGLNGTVNQNSADFSQAQWGNQFQNQSYNPLLSSEEPLNYNSTAYFDLSLGGVWKYGERKQSRMFKNNVSTGELGISYYHILRPKESIQRFGDNTASLYSRIVVSGNYSITDINSTRFGLVPSLLLMYQGPSSYTLIGTKILYKLKDASKYTRKYKNVVLLLGGHYRIKDAFAFSAEFDIDYLSFGGSYDFTVSRLSQTRNALGAYEIYIKYRII